MFADFFGPMDHASNLVFINFFAFVFCRRPFNRQFLADSNDGTFGAIFSSFCHIHFETLSTKRSSDIDLDVDSNARSISFYEFVYRVSCSNIWDAHCVLVASIPADYLHCIAFGFEKIRT